jgi:hypothetical protein
MDRPDAPIVVAAFKQAVADPNSALRRNLPGIDTSKAASASQFCYNDGQVAIACPASPAPTSTDDTTRIAIGVVVILLILLGEQGASVLRWGSLAALTPVSVALLIGYAVHRTSDRQKKKMEEQELAQLSAVRAPRPRLAGR